MLDFFIGFRHFMGSRMLSINPYVASLYSWSYCSSIVPYMAEKLSSFLFADSFFQTRLLCLTSMLEQWRTGDSLHTEKQPSCTTRRCPPIRTKKGSPPLLLMNWPTWYGNYIQYCTYNILYLLVFS